VRPIRFHDLRASGITWMAVRGDDPQKIQARAGHTDFNTTQGYIRKFGDPKGT
jgi:integrase